MWSTLRTTMPVPCLRMCLSFCLPLHDYAHIPLHELLTCLQLRLESMYTLQAGIHYSRINIGCWCTGWLKLFPIVF